MCPARAPAGAWRRTGTNGATALGVGAAGGVRRGRGGAGGAGCRCYRQRSSAALSSVFVTCASVRRRRAAEVRRALARSTE